MNYTSSPFGRQSSKPPLPALGEQMLLELVLLLSSTSRGNVRSGSIGFHRRPGTITILTGIIKGSVLFEQNQRKHRL
jgi:hypothetical protein